MTAELLAISVSMGQTFIHQGKEVPTGIFKTPVAGPVMLRRLNLDGDQQSDLKAHGGIHKAVYLYPHEHYAHWQAVLGRSDADMGCGLFGENFTTRGLDEASVCIGDVYQVGEAQLQVTQPRVPCFKLTHKLQASGDFGKQFLASGRVGFYARVLQEGSVQAGQPITLLAGEPRRVSVRDITALLYGDAPDLALAERALQVQALSPGWRKSLRKLLAD